MVFLLSLRDVCTQGQDISFICTVKSLRMTVGEVNEIALDFGIIWLVVLSDF